MGTNILEYIIPCSNNGKMTHTHLGSHNVRLVVDEKVESQTSLGQRRAASEAQALEHFGVIDYGLAKYQRER